MENEKDDIMRPGSDDTSGNIISEYTVEERETIKDIENKLGISWKEIEEANKDILKEGQDVTAGMRLKIPSKQ